MRRDGVVKAIEQVMPSVVNIATETMVEYHDWYEALMRNFYGWSRTPVPQETSINLGSGVIIDEEGYILTNFHVVRRATRIQVKLWDGREYEAERQVATTASDLALLKLKAKPGERFRAIKFAPDDDLLLGETVLALGNPFGLGGSVTKGILSSKNRRPSTGNEPLNVEDWLQTDAAINPGNSGGPLVNLRAELIGINVAVYREEGGERGMGVGFSIPVKQVSAALSQFFAPEVTDSLWFGAHVKPVGDQLVVTAVQPGSPAARAGLKEGDQVLQANGQAPRGLIAFNRSICDSPNLEAKLTVLRGRERQNLTVRPLPFEQLIQQKLGLTLLEPTARTAERWNIKAGEGLFVDQVEDGSPAHRAGLQRGFLLAGINGQAASNLRVIGQIVADKNRGETVHLRVIVPRRLGGSYVEFREGVVDVQVR